MRRVGYLLGFVLVLTLTAAAQETPKAEVSLGFSYIRANLNNPAVVGPGRTITGANLNGGSGSFAYNVTPTLGLVADVGGYRIGQIGNAPVNSTLVSYLAGPRVSYRHFSRITPFAQTLFGAAHAGSGALGTAGTDNAFAMTAGGGLDARLTDHLVWRASQVEYLLTRFRDAGPTRNTQNNLRVSTGLVFQFGK